MSAHLNCAVIGAGAVGSSAALHLVRAGARVRVFEQFEIGHVRGSSHGPTRLLRIAYFEHPDYVPLMRRCVPMWRALEAAVKTNLFAQSGVLEVGPPEGFLVGGVRRAANQHGLLIENLSRQGFERRFPWFYLPQGDDAVVERDAGYLLADKAIAASVALAKDAGALFHARERALSWRSSPSGVTIKTESDDYLVDRLVVAPGVWAPSFLGGDVAPVSIKEMSLYWVAANDNRFMTGSGFIPFAFETRDQRMFYGFPAIDADGVKIGDHTAGAPILSPDARTGLASEGDRKTLERFLRNYAPGLPPAVGRSATCLYELSPDQNFLIGRHPDEPRVAFAAGLSGHGFKFAPVIGEALAALAFDKEPIPEMRFLDPGRFKRP